MASESALAELVQLGHDITSFKLYAISLAALWAYDYFLTVDDEIRYAWKTKGLLMFVLFLLTRYLPVPYLVWGSVLLWYPGYTSEMCDKTVFIDSMYLTFITAVAQVVLAQRTYAITRKNKRVAGILYAALTAEFSFGVYIFVRAAMNPVSTPVIPLDAYHLCLTSTGGVWIIAQISLSLAFDVAVFVLVVAQKKLMKSMSPGVNVPSILDIVTRDAGIYFAVISSSHFLMVVIYSTVKRPVIQGLATTGNSVFIPIMIARMITSLKKAASTRQPHMDLEVPIGSTIDTQNRYSSHAVDGIHLPVLRQ